MAAPNPRPLAVVGERTGTDRMTGKFLSGFDHVVQSIWVILTTRVNTRVMLLPFGSDIPGLIDHPGNKTSIALLYSAIAQALQAWEPGFRVIQFQLQDATSDGAFTILLAGIYFPRGHLGDYSVFENRTARFLAAAIDNGVIFTSSPP